LPVYASLTAGVLTAALFFTLSRAAAKKSESRWPEGSRQRQAQIGPHVHAQGAAHFDQSWQAPQPAAVETEQASAAARPPQGISLGTGNGKTLPTPQTNLAATPTESPAQAPVRTNASTTCPSPQASGAAADTSAQRCPTARRVWVLGDRASEAPVFDAILHALAPVLSAAVEPFMPPVQRAVLRYKRLTSDLDWRFIDERTLRRLRSLRDDLREAVNSEPDDPETPRALHYLAELAERFGQDDEAIRMLEQCVAHPQVTPPLKLRALETLHRLWMYKRPGRALWCCNEIARLVRGVDDATLRSWGWWPERVYSIPEWKAIVAGLARGAGGVDLASDPDVPEEDRGKTVSDYKKEVVEALREGRAKYPQYFTDAHEWWALLNYARALGEEGRYDEVGQVFEQLRQHPGRKLPLSELAVQEAFARHLSDPAAEASFLEQALSALPPDEGTSKARRYLATRQFSAGRGKLFLEIFEPLAAAGDPDLIEEYRGDPARLVEARWYRRVNLGSACAMDDVNDPARAIAHLEQALTDFPQVPEKNRALVYFRLVSLYQRTQQYEAAIEYTHRYLAAAQETNPQELHNWYLFSLARNHAALGEYDEAITWAERARQLVPGFNDAVIDKMVARWRRLRDSGSVAPSGSAAEGDNP
jgi:tetratricopeptide (TPR) repeat protein